jgi:hypothetical protein
MFAYLKICSTESGRGLNVSAPATYHRMGSSFMLRRWVIILGVVTLGFALSGCTKCGPFWEDWMQPQKSCRSDHL